MKMIYRSKTNSPAQKIFLTLAIILVLISGFRLIFPNAWGAMVMNSSKVFLRTGNGLSSLGGRIVGPIGTKARISRENDELKNQIQNLAVRVSDRDALEKENVILRQMVGRKEIRDTLLATVLSKPTLTPYDTFIIDIGSNYGVKPNAMVLAGGVAVGTVTEVYQNLSKVTAYSSPDSRHAVFIGDKNIQAEAIGQGNGNFKIVLPEGSEVKVGDSVILPNIIPTIFGTVEKIMPSDQPSFISILFKAPVNVGELYYVQILK